MGNIYEDASSNDVPSHLFGWAVGDETSAPEVASRLVKDEVERRKTLNEVAAPKRRLIDEATALGSTLRDALEEEGFTADYELLPEGTIKVTFDDDDCVFNRRRRRLAEGVVSRLAEDAGAIVKGIYMPEHANGGGITVGLIAGVGFGHANTGIDPNFDPFAQRNVHFVNELDVNVSDEVFDRLTELSHMWDGSYSMYAEGAEATIDEMNESEQRNLATWIDGQMRRVGVPGSTLEEVLDDVKRRIVRRLKRA